MKTLALFDFDGTLYKKDSLIEFTKFSKGVFAFYGGIIFLSPYLIAMKIKLMSNEKVKIKFISYFFGRMKEAVFLNFCESFALNHISKNLDPKLFFSFIKHLENRDTIYIVTASIPEWIAPWSNKFGVEVIGTKIEIIDSSLTGNFSSKNCYGKEKVNRITHEINLDNFTSIYTYGSGKGDAEMLKLSRL
ncbi:HAD superfamily phosphoserine phosphatase-like hydrolase [Flavobacterium arsenatis]|uniref:HAD superfamily phosphoserine phosphatase-like hydrolase n=1 Tax=Flavobacterium arsenatis TaxID=1484332 RepID=A0ABU1TNW3_9FLAO|nr:HAD family hydrolase [Flavobacterium arsenatis]MDR6967666.1 HAD superfamily phosphoserine phosphatase-like hydrolase [Flavobacterium arsenatis]